MRRDCKRTVELTRRIAVTAREAEVLDSKPHIDFIEPS
jgi:hypothetical protein